MRRMITSKQAESLDQLNKTIEVTKIEGGDDYVTLKTNSVFMEGDYPFINFAQNDDTEVWGYIGTDGVSFSVGVTDDGASYGEWGIDFLNGVNITHEGDEVATFNSDKIQLGSTYVLTDYAIVGTVEDEDENKYNCTLKITGLVRQNTIVGPELYLVAPLNAEQVTTLDTNKPASLIFYFDDESNDIWGEFTAIPEYELWIGNNKFVWDGNEETYVLANTWNSIAALQNPVIRLQLHTSTHFASIANV